MYITQCCLCDCPSYTPLLRKHRQDSTCLSPLFCLFSFFPWQVTVSILPLFADEWKSRQRQYHRRIKELSRETEMKRYVWRYILYNTYLSVNFVELHIIVKYCIRFSRNCKIYPADTVLPLQKGRWKSFDPSNT